VNSVLQVNNGFSLVFDGVFRDMRAAEFFVEDLVERFRVRKKMVFYVIGVVSREAFLTEPSTADFVLMIQ